MTERATNTAPASEIAEPDRIDRALEAAFAEEQGRSRATPRACRDARLELAIEGALATIDELAPRH